MAQAPHYHVLLIGCDKYPPNQNSLHGCVNDIEAIEDILFSATGVGIPTEQIHLTRLAAEHNDWQSRSRFHDQSQLPTRDNIVKALQYLASDTVGPEDRVLIYYSGHGGQTQCKGKQGWYECLVACDNRLIFDQELNPLIAAIAKRTKDLTIVLDCCHSAGVTRAYLPEPENEATRAIIFNEPVDQQPDPALTGDTPTTRGSSAGLLKGKNPEEYIAIVACQSHEKAREKFFPDIGRHGLLTYGLMQIIGDLDQQQRRSMAWAHIWPKLLDQVVRAASDASLAQHPWLIGQPARKLFGGAWQPHDPGFVVRRNDDGSFAIEAGSMLGFDSGAEIAIYGPEPAFFPELDTEADHKARIGRLRITKAERATSIAEAIEQPADPLPHGARARLILPAQHERLQVWLDPADPDPTAALAQSALLELVQNKDDADIWVDRSDDGWLLSNDTNKALATLRVRFPSEQSMRKQVVRDAHATLRAGLNAYASYQAVLRLAARCNDFALDQSVHIALLDCRDTKRLAEADSKNPDLPEIGRDENGINQLISKQPFCIRVTNTYLKPLAISILNCTAGGKVQHLGTIGINGEDTETLWFKNIHREPFIAVPDNPTIDTIDRIIAIGTTRAGSDLRNLATDMTIQEIFDHHDRSISGALPNTSELWTATIHPLKMLAAEKG